MEDYCKIRGFDNNNKKTIEHGGMINHFVTHYLLIMYLLDMR